MSRRLQDILEAVRRPTTPSHLEPVRDRFDAQSRALGEVQRELAEEMGASLGRAARRVTAALTRLDATEAEIQAARADGDAERERALCRRFNTERHEAAARLRDLRIQREALGFRRNEELARHYPLPEPKRPI